MSQEAPLFPELHDETKHPQVRIWLFDLRVKKGLLGFSDLSDLEKSQVEAMIDGQASELMDLSKEVDEDMLRLYGAGQEAVTEVFQSTVKFKPEYPSEE